MKACVSGRQRRLGAGDKCEWCGALAKELVASAINPLKEPQCFVYRVFYDKPLVEKRRELIRGQVRWPVCDQHKVPLELDGWSQGACRPFCPEWRKDQGWNG